MKHFGQTRAFRGPDGQVVVGSIAEVAYRRLGGLDQWVMIRGENIDNPPLIVLHGGPGLSDAGWMRHFNAPLETHFTVVHWDQRGTGRSFNRHIPRSSMTLEQFMADLDQLVDAVRRRLGKTKVVIFGHSWGSVLGALYAARFPEKVAAYVGGAQIGDWPAAESMSYAFALAEAQRLGNEKAMRKLRAIGPPPYSAASVFTERAWESRLEGRMSAKEFLRLARVALAAPESSLFDLVGTVRGFWFSMDAMWPEVSRSNLIQAAPTFKMPVFFFLGRNDHWVPPETSIAYFDALAAPSKQVIWFEGSGHEMFVDEAGKFNDAMTRLVRPVSRVDSLVPPSAVAS